jgi:hypothetical protein
MIQQKGCMSEKLLRCKDAPEFISYSEWESEAVIEAVLQQDQTLSPGPPRGTGQCVLLRNLV